MNPSVVRALHDRRNFIHYKASAIYDLLKQSPTHLISVPAQEEQWIPGPPDHPGVPGPERAGPGQRRAPRQVEGARHAVRAGGRDQEHDDSGPHDPPVVLRMLSIREVSTYVIMSLMKTSSQPVM